MDDNNSIINQGLRGANVRVMEMLKRIKSVDKVEDYIKGELDAGRVIFGLGHAVYKTV